MDLKNFVSQTLIQIVEGISEAKQHIDGLGIGAAVNPGLVSQSAPDHARASDESTLPSRLHLLSAIGRGTKSAVAQVAYWQLLLLEQMLKRRVRGSGSS